MKKQTHKEDTKVKLCVCVSQGLSFISTNVIDVVPLDTKQPIIIVAQYDEHGQLFNSRGTTVALTQLILS